MVNAGDATAVAAIVGSGDSILAEARAGWRDVERRERLGRWDRFDLASLTKPWVATLALRLEGALPLATTLGEVWPATPKRWRRRSLESLLRHRSGLPAWWPLYRLVRDPVRAGERLLATEERAPIPTYSDVGYLLYARAAEAVLGRPAEALLENRVTRPLGIKTVSVDPDPRRAVYCALDNGREVELAKELRIAVAHRGPVDRGIVQDGNARFLGGLAGHAGLFGSAYAVWRLGTEWLEPERLLSMVQVRRGLAGAGHYRLGWWRRDPRRRRVLVLLAHRAAIDTDLDRWRARFHRLAVGRN